MSNPDTPKSQPKEDPARLRELRRERDSKFNQMVEKGLLKSSDSKKLNKMDPFLAVIRLDYVKRGYKELKKLEAKKLISPKQAKEYRNKGIDLPVEDVFAIETVDYYLKKMVKKNYISPEHADHLRKMKPSATLDTVDELYGMLSRLDEYQKSKKRSK